MNERELDRTPPGAMIYRDAIIEIFTLEKEEIADLIMAYYSEALDIPIPEKQEVVIADRYLNALLTRMLAAFAKDKVHYNRKVSASIENGKKGGRPPKNPETNKYSEKPNTIETNENQLGFFGLNINHNSNNNTKDNVNLERGVGRNFCTFEESSAFREKEGKKPQ